MTGLETLFPEPRFATLNGREIEVMPLRVKQLAAFSKAIRPALSLLISGQFALAAEEHFDGLAQAVSIGTGVSVEELESAWGDEFVSLLRVVVEGNLDFFVRRLAPALQSLVPVLVAIRPPSAGAMPGSASPPSSAAGATGSTTSAS